MHMHLHMHKALAHVSIQTPAPKTRDRTDLSSRPAAATVAQAAPAFELMSNREESIARPVARAAPFVPRLGKRANERLGLHELLCANYGIDCGRLMEELNQSPRGNEPTLRLVNALIRGIAAKSVADESQVNSNQDQVVSESELLELVAQQLKRETRASESAEGGTKRLAFTPRIG